LKIQDSKEIIKSGKVFKSKLFWTVFVSLIFIVCAYKVGNGFASVPLDEKKVTYDQLVSEIETKQDYLNSLNKDIEEKKKERQIIIQEVNQEKNAFNQAKEILDNKITVLQEIKDLELKKTELTNEVENLNNKKDTTNSDKDKSKTEPGDETSTTSSNTKNQNVIANLNPDVVKVEITEQAKDDWVDDYEMQDYQIENQLKAYTYLVNQQIDQEHEAILLSNAANEWKSDYEMIRYQYENQIEAYNWLQNLILDTDIKKQVLAKAESEWGTDYEMVKYEYENQIESYQN
jgi:hypothetical protein